MILGAAIFSYWLLRENLLGPVHLNGALMRYCALTLIVRDKSYPLHMDTIPAAAIVTSSL